LISFLIAFCFVFPALYNLKSPSINIDLPTVESNILLIHMLNPKLTASQFSERLKTVTEKELKAGITADKDGKQGIVVKSSARDWAYARIVLYHQITDYDVELAIKKLVYVIKEFDSTL